MRCKKCDYALWNLRTRNCPECGEPFVPSEFEFQPNTTNFICPHCEQHYYGTSPQGHLVPTAFECVTCGRHVSMDEMIVRPAPGVSERETEQDCVPWRHPERFGWWKSLFKTIVMALIAPHRMMRALPMSSSTAQAWGFGFIVNVIVMLCAILPLVMLFGFMAMMIPGGGGRGGGGAAAGMCFGSAIIGILIGCAGFFIGVCAWALSAHLLLRLTGPMQGSIGRTFQAILYSSGANIAFGVPCIGWYFGWIWWVVSATIALCVGQSVAVWRAILAGTVIPLVMLALFLGGYFALIMTSIAAGGATTTVRMGSTLNMTAQQRTAALNRAMIRFHTLNGSYPAHALELIGEGRFDPMGFGMTETATQAANFTIGGISINEFYFASSSEQRRLAARVAQSLPADVIAHRTGDFVFTCHMLPAPGDAPQLWIVIASPDPDINTARDINGMLDVGLADRTTIAIDIEAFGDAMAAQNDLRRGLGLPALPLPWEITHADPAVAEAVQDANNQ